MVTRVDENIQKAKEYLNSAYCELLTVIDPSTNGQDYLNKDYVNDVYEIIGQLLKIQGRL